MQNCAILFQYPKSGWFFKEEFIHKAAQVSQSEPEIEICGAMGFVLNSK